MVNRQPLGVVACITSYNFPMVNMAGKVAPALAAGNTVVVKPAPQDPLAIVELVRILNDVGFLREWSTSSTATVRPRQRRWWTPTTWTA